MFAVGLLVGHVIACGDDGSGGGSTMTASPSTGGSDPSSTSNDARTSGATGSARTSSSSGEGASGSTSTGTASTGMVATSGDVKPADCDALPPLPAAVSVLAGPISSEDFVFSEQGHLVNVANGAMYRTAYGGGPMLAFPGVGNGWTSGTAMLPNGDLVFCDSGSNSVIRVARDGSTTTLASGLAYPNGLTVDLNGLVYVTENAGDRLLRINAMTLDVDVVVDVGLSSPNGVAFDSTYENLYIGSFGGGTVHRFNLDSGELTVYASNIGTGGLDGVIVDECDNVYVTDFGPAIVYRVTPQGAEVVADLGTDFGSYWIPNLHFGSGVGGWDATILYVMDLESNSVYELDLGVQGIPLPHL